MLSPGNTVRMEAVAETTTYGNNASTVTWDDQHSSQGNRASAEHMRAVPHFPQQVLDEPWGQVLTEITLGERLSLVSQGGWTTHAQCHRDQCRKESDSYGAGSIPHLS